MKPVVEIELPREEVVVSSTESKGIEIKDDKNNNSLASLHEADIKSSSVSSISSNEAAPSLTTESETVITKQLPHEFNRVRVHEQTMSSTTTTTTKTTKTQIKQINLSDYKSTTISIETQTKSNGNNNNSSSNSSSSNQSSNGHHHHHHHTHNPHHHYNHEIYSHFHDDFNPLIEEESVLTLNTTTNNTVTPV